MMVTKGHKIILWDENNNVYILTGQELYEKINQKDYKVFNSYVKSSINVNDDNDNVGLKDANVELIDFNDYVYCVSVPNKTWLMKHNVSVSFTHNCDHPDSAIVSLSNTSHKIMDMWWQGEELYGKIMIAYTPAGDILRGLLKTGFRLGISSRGVGSVKTVKGEDVVQNDFELIAFDFVSSPSTPGAYMFKEGRQWGLIPITEDEYKRIKCENGICRLVDYEEELKFSTPSINNIQEQYNKYKNLIVLSNNDFWKKI
jgi:hypothetical protein